MVVTTEAFHTLETMVTAIDRRLKDVEKAMVIHAAASEASRKDITDIKKDVIELLVILKHIKHITSVFGGIKVLATWCGTVGTAFIILWYIVALLRHHIDIGSFFSIPVQ